jgi:hypothetical protein
MRAFCNADCVTDTNLVTLHIQGNSAIGPSIALTTELLGAHLSNNAVVVDYRELFSPDANNDSNLVCGPSTAEDD